MKASKITYTFWLRKDGRIGAARHSPINNKRPEELVIMAETRKLLINLLQSIDISPDLRSAIEVLMRARLRRTAPFTPLTEEQRMGWLDEVTRVACHTNLSDSFTSGRNYNVTCNTSPTRQIISRQTLDGGTEEVLISGTEMLITLMDNYQRRHCFCHIDPPFDPLIHQFHPLSTLPAHFEIPPAPDIKTIFPNRYRKYTEELTAL
jgi:hypothetical protein